MNDTGHPATARQTLGERYGGDRPGRRRLIVVVVVVVAGALLGWLLWAAWVHATVDVRGAVRGYAVVSDHRVTIQIDVTRDSGRAVRCTVRAQAEDHTIVGEDEITIPAGESGAVSFAASLATDRRATSATVSACR